jgi:hypothetical protein
VSVCVWGGVFGGRGLFGGGLEIAGQAGYEDPAAAATWNTCINAAPGCYMTLGDEARAACRGGGVGVYRHLLRIAVQAGSASPAARHAQQNLETGRVLVATP